MTLSLPITEIIVQDRQRDLREENVNSLAESMKQLGLIQPIIINQDKRLIAGGHRLAAAKKLGWTHIFVVYRETMTEDELQECELTENIKRSDNTWQETCLAIAKIHFLKVKRSALDSKSWGHRDTGNLLNVNQANVTYSLIVARELINDSTKSNDFWKAENFSAAYGLLQKRSEDAALARLANQQTSIPVNSIFDTSDTDAPFIPRHIEIEDLKAPCTACGGSDVNCLECNGTGYEHKRNPKIPLSQRYIKGDSIILMNSVEWKEKFDHVITDIPFGIDIDYIDQSNSIKNITDIKAEHTVEGNLELHAQFFKAAFNCIKEQGFCITWLDIMQWQRMFDLAVDAGFRVTRWPFYWCKTYPCLNQMAQYNFTKSVEVAMICRKGNVTLPEKQPNNYILCGKDEFGDGHPFAKPFQCWERLITAVSLENQTILDPFCGSGSCYKSGVKLSRVMVGVEKDEALYNSGLESIKQFYLQMNPKIIFV